MKILSKSTGIVYENIVLCKLLEDGFSEELVDTEMVDEINFKDYYYAYTRLCDNCIKIAKKEDQSGVDGVHCFNENCNSNANVWEVYFTEEEIHNDFIAIK